MREVEDDLTFKIRNTDTGEEIDFESGQGEGEDGEEGKDAGQSHGGSSQSGRGRRPLRFECSTRPGSHPPGARCTDIASGGVAASGSSACWTPRAIERPPRAVQGVGETPPLDRWTGTP